MCRIISNSELANKTDIELSALFQEVSQNIAKSETGTPEQRNCLGSLENIRREQSSRQSRSPALKPPGF